MRLRAAARYFDDTPVFEAYEGEYLWDCQFSSFNDANAVGSTSTRRVLSIAPGLRIPERRAIRILGDYWLVGDGNPDAWRKKIIRQSFNMKKATGQVDMLTPGQACLSAAGERAWAQAIYFKDSVNTLNNADYDPFWNYFMAPGEPVRKGYFLRDKDKLFRVRSAYLPLEDLRICQSDEVDAGPLPGVFGTGVYVPATDSFTGTSVTTPVLLLDQSKVYNFLSKASERAASGDIMAYAAQSAVTPVKGQFVVISSIRWNILQVDGEQDAWLMRLRRA